MGSEPDGGWERWGQTGVGPDGGWEGQTGLGGQKGAVWHETTLISNQSGILHYLIFSSFDYLGRFLVKMLWIFECPCG